MKQIRSLTFEELIRARADIEAAIELFTARERRELLGILRAKCVTGAGGRSATRSRTGGHPLKGKKLLPKYRDPEDRSQVWAGRGNMPRWLSAALKAGKKLESFAVR